MSILVACIGNIFQGDDAFGCEVAKVLASRISNPFVQIVDFGIRGLDLSYRLLDTPDLTILVDVVSRGGEPGTIYTIAPDVAKFETTDYSALNPHAMDPVRVLQAVRSMGGKLGRILLVGCEPEDLGGEEGLLGLTPSVLAAVEPASRVIEDLIQKELVEA